MIGFAMVGSRDIPRARGFYDALMPLLEANLYAPYSTADRLWYAVTPTAPMLVVTLPLDGRPATVGNGVMIALIAPSRAAVAAVHARAVTLGGADEGGPRERSDDPDDLYRAYFRDLDGNKLMVFAMSGGR